MDTEKEGLETEAVSWEKGDARKYLEKRRERSTVLLINVLIETECCHSASAGTPTTPLSQTLVNPKIKSAKDKVKRRKEEENPT